MEKRIYFCVGTGVNKDGAVYSTLCPLVKGKDDKGRAYEYIAVKHREYFNESYEVGKQYTVSTSVDIGNVK